MFRVGIERGFLNDEGRLAWGDIGIGALEGAQGVEVSFLPAHYAALTPELAGAYQGFILGGLPVTDSSFGNGAQNLIVLARHGVGYDRIDVEACTANDVALCTTPAASKHPVASASFAYMITLAKRMVDKDWLVRHGRWDLRGTYCGNEVYGKTLGIVGFGNTGGELARLAEPFAMRVLAHDPFLDADAARARGVEPVALDDLLRQADFVCIHAMLTPATRGLIGRHELALMKPTAYLINCARGPIVDEAALTEALVNGRIAGAGLDVFEDEPPPRNSQLIELNNVMLSPHTMAHTLELSIAMGEINSAQMLAAASGEPPPGVVNRAVLQRPGFQAKLKRWRGK